VTVALCPNDIDACTELAKVLIVMEKNDEARPLLERVAKIDPADYVTHLRPSTLYREQGKTDEAKQQAELYPRYKKMRDELQQIIPGVREQGGSSV
jgi:hypothetical protein